MQWFSGLVSFVTVLRDENNEKYHIRRDKSLGWPRNKTELLLLIMENGERDTKVKMIVYQGED